MGAASTLRGYAVVTYPRCGSNWFAQLLGSTGVLGRPEDWFNGQGYRDRGETDYPMDRAGQRAMMLSRGMSANGVFGVKLMPARIDDLAGFQWVSDFPDLRVVHLTRRDRLGRALSDVKAQQTRQYRSISAIRGAPRYDEAMIGHALEAQATGEARVLLHFARNGIAPLEISYEDLVEDASRQVRRVAAFLDVDDDVAIDQSQIDLAVQRDETQVEWRARFLAAHRDPAHLPRLNAGKAARMLERLARFIGR